MDIEMQDNVASDDNIDLFRHEFPLAIISVKLAVKELHEQTSVNDNTVKDIADKYGIPQKKLMGVGRVKERMNHSGEKYTVDKPHPKGDFDYDNVDPIPPTREFQLLTNIMNGLCEEDYMNVKVRNWTAARARTAIINVATELLGMTPSTLVGITRWKYYQIVRYRSTHHDLLQISREYNVFFNTLKTETLNQLKEENYGYQERSE